MEPDQAKEIASPSTGEAGSFNTAESKENVIVLDSASLLQGQQGVLIRHGSEIYRLSRTRQGKLILTK